MIENKTITYNYPQYLFHLCRCRVNVILWGRATGKTTGPIASNLFLNVMNMPRSLGFWAAPSYEKMLTQMIPNIRAGLQMYGLKENVHYVIGKFLPKEWDRPLPYKYPEKPKNFIHFYNGSGIALISLDRVSTMGNGLDTDWGMVDEAKLCSKDALDEIFLTLRGNKQHFGHLAEHYSLMIASDKPKSAKGRWLLEYKNMVNKKELDLLLETSLAVLELEKRLEELQNENPQRPFSIIKCKNEIYKFSQFQIQLRKRNVYVSEASTLDNLVNLGWEPIIAFKKLLSDEDFRRSVLNQDVFEARNGFYNLLSDEEHGYESNNNAFLDSLDIKNPGSKDCRWDGDLNPSQPLHIACDYNNKINSAVVGQFHNQHIRQLASFYVKKPKFIKDLAEKIASYYQYKPVKHILFYYDQTADKVDAAGNKTFADIFMDTLRLRGWAVTPVRFAQPGFQTRYNLWQELLSGENEHQMFFGFNINNNRDWYTAMKAAETKNNGKTGFEKDKKSETDNITPPELSTHLTEASDTLVYGMVLKKRIIATTDREDLFRM